MGCDNTAAEFFGCIKHTLGFIDNTFGIEILAEISAYGGKHKSVGRHYVFYLCNTRRSHIFGGKIAAGHILLYSACAE